MSNSDGRISPDALLDGARHSRADLRAIVASLEAALAELRAISRLRHAMTLVAARPFPRRQLRPVYYWPLRMEGLGDKKRRPT
jgi:hypothetical protein